MNCCSEKGKYERYVLAALLGFAVFGATVKASVVDQVVVTIPFEFVAAGKTLPAGTYRVDRVFSDRPSALVLTTLLVSKPSYTAIVSGSGGSN